MGANFGAMQLSCAGPSSALQHFDLSSVIYVNGGRPGAVAIGDQEKVRDLYLADANAYNVSLGPLPDRFPFRSRQDLNYNAVPIDRARMM